MLKNQPKELSFPEELWRTKARGFARVERATRLTQMLMALIHAYHLPLVMDEWLSYDFSFFHLGFVARSPLKGFKRPDCELIVYDCDGDCVLEVCWDFYDDVDVKRFAPFWWEEQMTDIAFWAGKARWSVGEEGQPPPNLLVTVGNEAFGEPMLSGYVEAMADMRAQSLDYAVERARRSYAAGDADRGLMWDNLASMIDLADAPSSNRLLN